MIIYDPGLFADGTPLRIIDYFLGLGLTVSWPVMMVAAIAQIIKRAY